MGNGLRITVFLTVCLGAAACTPIQSLDDVAIEHSFRGLQGTYYLPRTLLNIDTGDGFVPEPPKESDIMEYTDRPRADRFAPLFRDAGFTEVAAGNADAPKNPNGPGNPPNSPANPATPTPASPTPATPPQVQRSDGGVQVNKFQLSSKIDQDPEAHLLYRFTPSSAADDVIEVDTDSNGLLTSVSSDNTDRTGDIAISVAQLIFTFSTQGAAPPTLQTLVQPPPVLPFKASYDPLDPDDVNLVRAPLAKKNFCILVNKETELPGTPLEVANKLCGKGSVAPPPVARTLFPVPVTPYALAHPGIYYRKTVSLPVHVYSRIETGADWTLVWAGQEQFFDPSELYQVTIDRASFVQKKTLIKFSDGSLTSIRMEKPSQTLAFMSIPVKVARIIFAIPLAGLQQDTALVQAQTNALNAEVARATAETNLLKLQAQQTVKGIELTPIQ
jgi:hypothetical protein